MGRGRYKGPIMTCHNCIIRKNKLREIAELAEKAHKVFTDKTEPILCMLFGAIHTAATYEKDLFGNELEPEPEETKGAN